MKKEIKKTNKKVSKKQNKNRNNKFILIIDYLFLISLASSIILGIQTNSVFFVPFVISVIILVVCMIVILVHSIYMKVLKRKSKRGE